MILGPIFSLSTRYAQLLVVVFVSMAYCGGIPAMYATLCFTCFVVYWGDKVRRCA